MASNTQHRIKAHILLMKNAHITHIQGYSWWVPVHLGVSKTLLTDDARAPTGAPVFSVRWEVKANTLANTACYLKPYHCVCSSSCSSSCW